MILPCSCAVLPIICLCRMRSSYLASRILIWTQAGIGDGAGGANNIIRKVSLSTGIKQESEYTSSPSVRFDAMWRKSYPHHYRRVCNDYSITAPVFLPFGSSGPTCFRDSTLESKLVRLSQQEANKYVSFPNHLS